MENLQTENLYTHNLYRDMQKRTGGEIYIGVVGPVRTGKSTFIKRFMDTAVLPHMGDEADRTRAQDELPQSAGGKTITTTEPKFIPQEAASIKLGGDVNVKVRLVDCVGFMVDGAAGHMEEGKERLVKTPWYDTEIPFTQAAEIGTRKVITDHSTIGIVVTTDGSFGELQRESYLAAEEKTIMELKKLRKPFLVLVNSTKPYSQDAEQTAASIREKYHVSTIAVNCMQLKEDDIRHIMEKVLYEFPVTMVEFYMPKWVEMLPANHRMKADMIARIKEIMEKISTIRNVIENPVSLQGDYIRRCMVESINMADGCVRVVLDMEDKYYYEMLSEMVGETIDGEYQLIELLKEMAVMKREYTSVLTAMQSAVPASGPQRPW